MDWERMERAIEMEPPPPEEVWCHPTEWALRVDRLPHIWCSGCGIGTSVNAFVAALEETKTDLKKLCVVSGIGCTGRTAGYMNADSFHTTHGRAIPFAIGLHLANPELEVVVFSGDGDLAAIGGNHLIHAARRNVDITVICINNFNYGMTGGQSGPTTHEQARTTTTPYGNPEHAFNLPLLVGAAGATLVARHTVADPGRCRQAIVQALGKKGFAFIEILSPCPINYGRRNKLGEALDEVKYYRENTILKHFAPLEEADLMLGGKIVVGTFIDKERPTFRDSFEAMRVQKFGGRG
jgi:2-oxoglutarate ferredoxin oxidoreductase subunit beta